MNCVMGQKTRPPRAGSTQYFTLDDDGDVLAARPTPPVEVRPQEREQGHIVELILVTFVPVQVLDAPVPQMGNQVVEVLQKIGMETPEQVVAVPKISLDQTPQRSAVRRTQKSEQWVEVPTILSFSSVQQRTVEQIVDIPVPRGCERGILLGFSPGHGSGQRSAEQNVDIPTPCRGRGSSVASQVPTLVGGLAGEAWSWPGACTEIANNNNRGVVHHGCRVTTIVYIKASSVW